jgi:glycosyltransferase involved in cell wall biosynthesis
MKILCDTHASTVQRAENTPNEFGVNRYTRTFCHQALCNPNINLSFFDIQCYTRLKPIPEHLRGHTVSSPRWLYYLYKRFKYLRFLNKFCNLPLSPKTIDAADIIYFPGVWYPILKSLCKRKSPPIFLLVHDLMPIVCSQYFRYESSASYYQILHGFSKRDNCWFMANSESTKNDLCNVMKIPPERVFVSYHAADKTVFYPCQNKKCIQKIRTKYGIPEGPYLLAMSRFQHRKNLRTLLKAFKILQGESKIKNLSLVIGGAAISIDDYTSLAEIRKPWAKDKVFHIGYIDEEDLSPLYSGALTFVFPSFYEGFGSPPLEAMHCGTPVIVSNTSSMPEVVGDAGIQFTPHDTYALADNILKLYQDSSLCKKLSKQGIERAKLFSWDKHITETLQAFRSTLA